MERPKGVTVLAYIYFVGVAGSALVTLIPSQRFQPLRSPRLLALSAGYLIIGVILGIGLLRMKNWSRWLAIIMNATRLLFVPHEVAVGSHYSVAVIRSVAIFQAGVHTLFCVWVIWYLTRPHVKTAFQSA
jgi:uncharacterized membrane protein (DUF2068 family)